MYVSVRRYTIGAGSIDALAHRLEEEFAPAISQEPGFLGYMALGAEDGAVEAISVFTDAASAGRSDDLAAAYLAEHLIDFEPSPLEVSGGEVLTSRMTPAMLEAAHGWRAARVRSREASRERPVLVLGATGRTGRFIVRGLLDRGVPARALVRDASRARAILPWDTTLVEGDLRHPEALAQAMTGVTAVVVATAGDATPDNSPVLVDYFGTRSVMQEAVAQGVDLVVFVSSIHVTRPEHYLDVDPMSLGWKARAEEVVRAAGVPYCIVRAGWLTDGPGGEPLALSQGDTCEGHLSRADLADVCVRVLLLAEALGKTFEVVAARDGEARPLERVLAELAPDGVTSATARLPA